jgi:hypothetical protein
MIKTVTIQIEVDVVCDITPERPSMDRLTPPEYASVVIQDVMLAGKNVTELLELSGFDFEQIENDILENL